MKMPDQVIEETMEETFGPDYDRRARGDLTNEELHEMLETAIKRKALDTLSGR